MSDLRLFRQEAIDARRARWHGDILLTQPPLARLVVVAAVAIATLIIAFLYFGTYTRRVTVAGQLVPVAGVAKVYVQQSGVVIESRVVEGQRVRKGDVLFVISSEQLTTGGDSQAVIAQQAALQKDLFADEANRLKQLSATESAAVRATVDRLNAEIPRLDAQIRTQRERSELARRNLERYQQLQAQGYVTQDQLVQRQAEALDQQRLLESLERDRIIARHALEDARSELTAVPLQYQNRLGELQRAIAGIEQTIVESELRRQVSVVAPEAGIISALTVHRGQWVDGATPLASLTPGEGELRAELYAPSRAVGQMHAGDAVHMRYQAFPYQKFGQFRGRVEQITLAAMTSAELTRSNAFDPGLTPRGEPLYRVIVSLETQSVSTYGLPQPLRAGMLLEADVSRDTRRLYQWALEPLYSLGAKL